MRIGGRTRETAALICALAASNQPHLFYPAEDALGVAPLSPAGRLARAAYGKVSESDSRPRHNAEICAEAEALIRTGWTP